MNLVIDIGNTSIKTALYENNRLVVAKTFESLSVSALESFLKNNNFQNRIKASIVSSVAHNHDDLLSFLKTTYRLLIFNYKTPIPVKNKYRSPQTLGNDRLASVVGAGYMFPESNVLVIDCGTCIKYDFVNHQKEYKGGAISPGLQMRFQALHTFTEKLPLIKYRSPEEFTGSDTESSIVSGVVNGAIMEMQGMINYYQSHYSELKIILSGGDAKYFADSLKISIFATPNIVSFGLNCILNYNESKH